MSSKNLQKYKVQSIDDALGVLEEAGEPIPPENPSKTSSLDRGNLPQATRGVFALHNSQKGKEDTFSFTLGVSPGLISMYMYSVTLNEVHTQLSIQYMI